MMKTTLSALMQASEKALALPILTLPGAGLIGRSALKLFTDSESQVLAARALLKEYGTPAWQSGMDLSVEAQEFGCEIRFEEDESPSVIGRLVSDEAGARALAVPEVGSVRSAVYLETLRVLSADTALPLAIGGTIGPFSLTGRIYGLSEACLATVMDPVALEILLEKTTSYILEYAKAQKAAGAACVVLAEPSAGLLSPDALEEFSSRYIKRIVDAVQGDGFEVIVHNCAATAMHLKSVFACGAQGYHFGAPMDMAAALDAASPDLLIMGNLDPSRVFCSPDLVQMRDAVIRLKAQAKGRRNFALSSGCDIPARAPVATLRAFFEAARE